MLAAIYTINFTNPDTRQRIMYGVCAIVLIVSAAFYPVMCLGAVRGRGRVIAALGAVFFGSAGLLSGAMLSGVWSWSGPVSLCYFGCISMAVSLYAFGRIIRLTAAARAGASHKEPTEDEKATGS